MKREYYIIAIALAISAFIYIFYRTPNTIINQLILNVINQSAFDNLKFSIIKTAPINKTLIFSLPEGLWVMCITLTSKPYYLRIKSYVVTCLYVPMIYIVILEFLQMFGLVNGRFDILDIVFSLVFWCIGIALSSSKIASKNAFAKLNTQSIVMYLSYAIVYLSHVRK